MATLIIQNISKVFNNKIVALDNINFTLQQGEIIAFIGESGSGKSTLLRIIAGFEFPTDGSVCIGERCIVSNSKFEKPEKRNIGMVFQDFALFPHLNIEENIAFGIKNQNKVNKKVLIQKFLNLINLSGYEKRYPHTLSGGQMQRVAIARALAAQPALLLLDEPMSNLDDYLKEKLRHEIRNILKQSNTTTILVTHDIYDAIQIADKIGIMNKGKILQIDTPENLYRKPINEFVAGIFSDYNSFEIDVIQQSFRIFNKDFNIEKELEDGKYKLLIYPQDVIIDVIGNIKANVLETNFQINGYEILLEIASEKLKVYSKTPIIKGIEVAIKFFPNRFIFIKK